jgi:ribosomal protein L9
VKSKIYLQPESESNDITDMKSKGSKKTDERQEKKHRAKTQQAATVANEDNTGTGTAISSDVLKEVVIYLLVHSDASYITFHFVVHMYACAKHQ